MDLRGASFARSRGPAACCRLDLPTPAGNQPPARVRSAGERPRSAKEIVGSDAVTVLRMDRPPSN